MTTERERVPLRPEGEAAPEIDFTAEEFADLAHRLRSVAGQGPTLKAMLSNNYNVLLGALDVAALSARPQPPQQPVAVKPLEWVREVDGVCERWGAVSACGRYEVGKSFDDEWYWWSPGNMNHPHEATEDGAKAACQADLDGRIRSALYAAPLAQPVAEDSDIEAAYDEGFRDGSAEGAEEAKGVHAQLFNAMVKWLIRRNGALEETSDGYSVSDILEALATVESDYKSLQKQSRAQPVADSDEFDEAYAIGKRDGYEEAIQELDVATGGDGEFKGSSFTDDTVDVPVMRARIIERLAQPVATAGERETGWLIEAVEALPRYTTDSIKQNGRMVEATWGPWIERSEVLAALRPPLTQAEEAGK